LQELQEFKESEQIALQRCLPAAEAGSAYPESGAGKIIVRRLPDSALGGIASSRSAVPEAERLP
jgi:hypothetical protein